MIKRRQDTLLLTGLLFCALGAAGVTVAALQAPNGGYTLVENWANVKTGDEWTGLAINGAGNIVALKRTDPPLVEFTPAGATVRTWGEKLITWGHGLRIDKEGFVWVTDGRAANGIGQQVFKMTADGKVVMTLGTKGVGGATETTFDGPCDVAFGANGDIFVADGHRNNRVVKFTKDGKFVKAWGERGAGPGQFSTPHGIAIDSRGRVFVADRGNARIAIYDQDGKFLEEWKQFGRPSGVTITADDTLYVSDPSSPERGVTVGSAKDGTVKFVITGTLPESAVIDRAGAIYAGETTSGRILRKFAPPR